MPLKDPPRHFLDTNLIMYPLGGPHPLREPCKKVLEKIRAGGFLPVTDTEVLQEIFHRYFSIGKAGVAEIAYDSLIRICLQVFPVRLQETDKALELLKRHKPITSRDAIHAAVMINNSVKEIISTDDHFDLIPEVKRIDPRKIS